MKKVIEFLRSQGLQVTDDGIITSSLPDGLEGITLINEVEGIGGEDIYTIIGNRIEKIDL